MKTMKIFPIQSDDPKVARACSILEGMTQSAVNAVLFEDSPEVWFQFYLGLYLNKPTFVLILRKDTSPERLSYFKFRKAHLTIVDNKDEKALQEFTENIAKWVKRNE